MAKLLRQPKAARGAADGRTEPSRRRAKPADALKRRSRPPVQGRPRFDGRPPVSRQQILEVAARLFRDLGYAGTSVRMIADELKIHTTSIFYQFPTKDAILEQLVSTIFAAERAFVMQFGHTRYDPDVALYKLVTEEVRYAASSDLTLQRIVLLPELRSGQFGLLKKEWDSMVGVYEQLIAAGQKRRLFVACDTRTAAESLFALVSLPILSLTSDRLPAAAALASTVADLSLRGLLRDAGRLPSIAREAARIDLTIR